MAFFTHQSQNCEVCSRIDRAAYDKIKIHVDTSPTQLEISCASPRVPEPMNGYALEDGDENAAGTEAYHKVVAPTKDAAELNHKENAV